MLLALLETQLRKSKAMGPTFVVFDAALENSPNRSAKFLYDAARREVVRKQRESVKDSLLNTSQRAAPGKATRNKDGPGNNGQKLPCHAFAKNGSCKFGAKCRFLHSKPEQATDAGSSNSNEKVGGAATPKGKAKAKGKNKGVAKNIPCKFQALGTCTKGDGCAFKHLSPEEFAAAKNAKTPEDKTVITAMIAPLDGCDEWVLDTGSGNDLCPKGTLGQRIKGGTNVTLETAMGKTHSDTVIKVALDDLDEDSHCVELPHTGPALSVGRRCAAHG